MSTHSFAADHASDLIVEDGYFTTADGLRVHYRDYQPATGPVGTPILCLHGLTRNERDFDDLAPRLAEMGRRVIAASQRGRGRSDPDPDPMRYLPATYVGDMLGLLDHLGLDRVAVIGTSMGGLMAIIMAAVTPGRLAGVVLNDIGPQINQAGLDRIKGYVGASEPLASWQAVANKVRAVNGEAFPRQTDEAFWMTFALRVARELPDGRVALDYDPAISVQVLNDDVAPADLWPLFDGLAQTPTLLVRGALSDLLAVETVAEMRRRKPDLEVVTVPDVGHAPLLDEPEVWPALREFLARL